MVVVERDIEPTVVKKANQFVPFKFGDFQFVWTFENPRWCQNLLVNSSFEHQIMDQNRHKMKKYLNHEKTHSAITSKMFKRLSHKTKQLYEVELVKPKIEQRANHCCSFFSKIC